MKIVARFLILLMTIVLFSPLASNEVEATSHTSPSMTTFAYKGFATEVSVVGEWNWSNPVPMVIFKSLIGLSDDYCAHQNLNKFRFC